MILPGFILAILACASIVYANNRLDVQTTSGTWRGFLNKTTGIQQWFGVRYARPPLGNLRFKAPISIAHPPSEVQNATGFGASCMQLEPDVPPFVFGADTSHPFSEDCLFMNVYRLANTSSNAKLPVLLYIHGGAFKAGTGRSYDGTEILKRSSKIGTPVLFVNFNYRLNIFGFLCTSHLPDADLNAGLLDQRLAIAYVKANIAAFGGDPDKVTIWGQSAGAASVSFHFLFPGSHPAPFRAGIANSGTATQFSVPPASSCDLPGNPFDVLLNLTKCSTRSPLKCLINLSAEQLVNTALTWPQTRGGSGSFIFQSPYERTIRRGFADLPFISGTTVDDGTVFVTSALNATIQSIAQENSLFDSFFLSQAFDSDRTVKNRTVVVAQRLYPPVDPRNASTASLFQREAQAFRDITFLAGTRLWSDAAARRSQKAYVYQFNQTLPGFPSQFGVLHTSENWLAFDGSRFPTLARFAEEIQDYWINFAVLSVPSPDWPIYQGPASKILLLRNRSTEDILDTFDAERTRFLNGAEFNREFEK